MGADWWIQPLNYLFCFSIGAVAGAAEIASRYRDSLKVLWGWPGRAYAGFNGGVAALAYYVLRAFDVTFAPPGQGAKNAFLLVCAASFGGMALLRSSLFNVRLGDETVSVGPYAVIQVLLKTIDREVDRLRARQRVEKAVALTEGLDFSRSVAPLPMVAAALLQNLDKAEADKVTAAIEELKKSGIDDRFKLVLLALQTMSLVGEDVLDETLKKLKPFFEPPRPSG